MRLRIAFFILMVTIAIAVGVKQMKTDLPILKELPHDALILAFGDSLTYGYGAQQHESYPARLEQLIGRRVINAGIPGELSQEGLKRLPALLERYRPSLLLLCHGGNDILQKKDPEILRKNLEAMILLAQQKKIDVLLIAVPEFALINMEPNPIYAEIAERYNLMHASDILVDVLHDSRYKSDYIHPNALGYEMMAKAIAEKIKNNYRIEGK